MKNVYLYADDTGGAISGYEALGTFTVTAATSGLYFVPITPCRVADTRTAAGPFGAPSLAGQATRNFTVPSSACNIPATAQAYSLNVAVMPPAGLDYLTVWPTGLAQPLVSTLNSDGRVKSNAAIVPAGAGGAISVFASNATDVILDIKAISSAKPYRVRSRSTPSCLAVSATRGSPPGLSAAPTSPGNPPAPSPSNPALAEFPLRRKPIRLI